MVFVNSMSDLFHPEVPDLFVRRCFETMLEVDRHVYQILTKRPARAARFFRKHGAGLFRGSEIPGHIWIGTSVEEEAVAFRIRHLNGIPARVRFLSCEPLIGPLDLEPYLRPSGAIHWVIVGGESGPKARGLDERWVRRLRDLCQSASVPFFFKQWGGITPKAGGRELDGEIWNEYPAAG
jgi:protein gp37